MRLVAGLTHPQSLAESVMAALEPMPGGGTSDNRVYMALAYAHFFLGNREEAAHDADTALSLVPSYWDFYPGAFNAIQYT